MKSVVFPVKTNVRPVGFPPVAETLPGAIERFDHGRPADVLLREREAFLSKLSEATLKRFEDLFKRINNTLGK